MNLERVPIVVVDSARLSAFEALTALMATIEHLNRCGPFRWSKGLKETELVIVCGRCNSSRGAKRLGDWFASPYCLTHRIDGRTVADRVKDNLRTAEARR